MMDHSEARRQNTEHWAACQHNIVRFLSQHLDTEFSEDEVNHVIGLIEVNAFEVKLGPATSDNDLPELGCREIMYYLTYLRGVLLTYLPRSRPRCVPVAGHALARLCQQLPLRQHRGR